MRCAECHRPMPPGAEVCPYDGGMPLMTVGEALERGPMSLSQAVKVVDRALESVAAGHAAGRIHGHLGPEVVAFSQRGSDLVVRVLEAEGPPEAAYTPPEGRPSAAGDAFAFGVMLYHMIVGRPPAPGGDAPSLSGHVLQDVPERLDDLIRQLTSPEPARRPAPLEAVRARLENLELDSTLTGARLAEVASEVEAERGVTLSAPGSPAVDPVGDTFIRGRDDLEREAEEAFADTLVRQRADLEAAPASAPPLGADVQDTLLSMPDPAHSSALDARTEVLPEPEPEPRGKWILAGVAVGLLVGGLAVALALAFG